jgi:esterase
MELHFEVSGKGDPLIILHGLFGSLDNWRGISARLARRFTLFLLDQRNHGRSAHAEHMDYSVMAEDVQELLASHGLSKAFVLGHSMGGKTAMQLSLLHPESVSKLVVADIAPRAYPPRHERMLAGMLALDLAYFESRSQMEAALAPAVPDVATRQFLLKNVVRSNETRFRWRMGLQQIQANYKNLTQAITGPRQFTGPVLFIRGANSDYLSETDILEIRRLFPQAELTSVQDADHLLHIQKPEVFVRVVTQFLLGVPDDVL